jgi:hypothetical protein
MIQELDNENAVARKLKEWRDPCKLNQKTGETKVSALLITL